MRPTANFLLHATPAVLIAAFASAMPAAAGNEEVYYTITLTPARVSKIDSFTVKQGVKPYKLDRVYVKSWSTSGDAAPPVGTSDLTMKRGTGPAAGMDGINRLIMVTTATGGCSVDKRYPRAVLEGGGKRYVFTDVRITSCSRAGPEEKITFVYGKLE